MSVRARVLAFSQRGSEITDVLSFLTVHSREELMRNAPKLLATERVSSGIWLPSATVIVEGLADPDQVAKAFERASTPCLRWLDGVVFRVEGVPAELRQELGKACPEVLAAVDDALRGWRGPPPDVSAGATRLRLSERAHLMGIVNVTPDSFSDGGMFLEPDAAVKHGIALVEEGADLLDVGGESTRPGAEPVEEAEEIRRVVPVVEALASQTGVPISVDTTKAGVARAALDAGASIVNDVSAARSDPAMLPLVAERRVPIVLMHMQGEPRTMQRAPAYRDVAGEVYAFLAGRAEAAVAAGVDAARIVVDPGIGFGKTREHNLMLLRRLRELTCLGHPVLVGTSRKSFIGTTLDLPVEDRLEGTAATVALAVANGAAILRVHDVRAMRRVVSMVEAVQRA